MKIKREYAPIIHTGFGNTYTREQMEKFVRWLDETGYSGFSAEGKSSSPTTDIDGWIDGYMRGLGYACEESRKRSRDVWIFDEWGYPTGTAAGKTMKDHPEWRSKQLHCAIDMVIEEGETVSVTAPDHLLAAAAWHVNRNVFASPAGGYELIPVVDGKLTYTATHRRCRFVAATWEYDNTRTVGVFVHDPEDDTQCTLDLLCREAVKKLLSVMHEEYHHRLGEYFGRTIRGFFYDEPFLSFPLPYTFDIIDEFIERKGYDPTEKLPLLVTGGGGKVHDDWRDVCTTRMAEGFFGQMREWCHHHGVELVGHQDLDHDIRSLSSVSGDFFKNNIYNDAPGVDYIWAQIRPDHTADFPRFAGSFRKVTGKRHATSESFAATGRCMTPDYIRWAMEYQIVRGIDRFYLMIADPDVENDTGYGTPFDAGHKISREYGKIINRHVNITNQLANEGKPSARVALYVPRRELASEYPPARPNRVSLHMPWEWVNDTAEAMIYAPIDFDYIWDDIIVSETIVDGGALLLPSGERIDTIVFPAVYAFDERVEDKLHKMKAAGAKLIFISFPAEGFVDCDVCVYPKDIAAHIDRDVIVTGNGRVSVTKRTYPDGEYYFFLNESMTESRGRAVFAPGEKKISSFDYETLEFTASDGELMIHPLGIKVLRVSDNGGITEKYRLSGIRAEIGEYTVTRPDGESYVTAVPEGIENADYTGFTEYRSRVIVTDGGRYRLSLGRVAYAATVTMGNTVKKLPFAPYTAEFDLESGEYEMKISVLNADAAAILGTPENEMRSRTAGSFKSIFENDREFTDAGLFGPVVLEKLELIK